MTNHTEAGHFFGPFFKKRSYGGWKWKLRSKKVAREKRAFSAHSGEKSFVRWCYDKKKLQGNTFDRRGERDWDSIRMSGISGFDTSGVVKTEKEEQESRVSCGRYPRSWSIISSLDTLNESAHGAPRSLVDSLCMSWVDGAIWKSRHLAKSNHIACHVGLV